MIVMAMVMMMITIIININININILLLIKYYYYYYYYCCCCDDDDDDDQDDEDDAHDDDCDDDDDVKDGWMDGWMDGNDRTRMRLQGGRVKQVARNARREYFSEIFWNFLWLYTREILEFHVQVLKFIVFHLSDHHMIDSFCLQIQMFASNCITFLKSKWIVMKSNERNWISINFTVFRWIYILFILTVLF